MGADTGGERTLTARERETLESIESATSLAVLSERLDTDTEHEAYISAKQQWQTLRQKQLGSPPDVDGLPGDMIPIDGTPFHIHGITHADTAEEREFLREHVQQFLDAGATVYCEQGIRSMYFDDMPDVCEMDDYRWAMHHCRTSDIDSHIDGIIEETFQEDSVSTSVRSAASQFREAVFSLIDSGGDVYGKRFQSALGDVASTFLMDHEHVATGQDFASFERSRRAAKNPEALVDLQHYYRTVFLPQPLEREWLRRHDPELELFTHARNERMAEYILAQSDGTPMHVITGAAHQPGITYYLEAYRDGRWDYDSFEVVP